jgi:pentatricopeptide repeat protein
MYVKCGDMGSARRVLDAMSSKGNVHVWNLIMGGYAKVGEFEETLAFLCKCMSLESPPMNMSFLAF